MNNSSTSQNKALLLAYTREDVMNCVPLISELHKEGTPTTVLGLDFRSWAELRRRSIPYKTPADYLDRDMCTKIDAEAVALAHTWYEPIADKVTYKNISLGEMVEYDFSYLFIDALRAVEIAGCLLTREEPNKIFFPSDIPLFRANAVRYEALPSAILYLARLKRIRVSYLQSNPIARPTRTKIMDKARSCIRGPIEFIAGIYPNARHWRTGKVRTLIPGGELKEVYVFLDVPDEVFSTIKEELERGGRAKAVRMWPHMILEGGKCAGRARTSESTAAMCRSLEECGQLGDGLVYAGVRLEDILEKRLSSFFVHGSVELASWIEGVLTFIRDRKPDMLVTMEDISPIYRTLMRVAKINGIPTVVIQHGVTTADMGGFHVMPVEADKQAVWGNSSRQWAIERGKCPDTQVVTGNPKYDSIGAFRSRSADDRMAVCHELGLKSQRRIVIVATVWYGPVTSRYVPEDEEAFIRSTLNALKSFPEVQIVVKLHPAYCKEYEELTRAIANELEINDLVITQRFLWELLEMCALLITATSSVALDAMILHKPVITFNPGGTRNLSVYSETDATIKVHKAEDLPRAIGDALYNEEVQRTLARAREEFVYEYAYLQDGKASQRVANLIEQMTSRRQSSRN